MKERSQMAPKKNSHAAGLDSPFKSADKLYREDKVKSDNQKRFERWTDMIVREHKLPSTWRKDPEAELKAKWVDGKTNISPVPKTAKGIKK